MSVIRIWYLVGAVKC